MTRPLRVVTDTYNSERFLEVMTSHLRKAAVIGELPLDADRIYVGPPDRCYLCRRREVDMNVTLDGAVRGLCSTCWERGQDEIRIPLDYTTDEGDDDG